MTYNLQKLIIKYNFYGEVILIDEAESASILENSNIVFITGSALSTGTMESLLEHSKKAREVIIQVPSASIFPIEFFKTNVTHIFTTIKTKDELELGELNGAPILKVVDKNYVHIYPG